MRAAVALITLVASAVATGETALDVFDRRIDREGVLSGVHGDSELALLIRDATEKEIVAATWEAPSRERPVDLMVVTVELGGKPVWSTNIAQWVGAALHDFDSDGVDEVIVEHTVGRGTAPMWHRELIVFAHVEDEWRRSFAMQTNGWYFVSNPAPKTMPYRHFERDISLLDGGMVIETTTEPPGDGEGYARLEDALALEPRVELRYGEGRFARAP